MGVTIAMQIASQYVQMTYLERGNFTLSERARYTKHYLIIYSTGYIAAKYLEVVSRKFTIHICFGELINQDHCFTRTFII